MSDEYYLDRDQLHQLENDLATIAEHLPDSINVLTRQTCYARLPGHSPDTPLPYSEKASQLLHDLAHHLPAICEQAGYTTPHHNYPAIIDCLHWLQENPMKLATYEDAPKCADDIAGWANKIMHLVDRPHYPNFIGPCPKCKKPIYSYHTQGETTCTCGTTLDITTLKTTWMEHLDHEYFTRHELRNYLTTRGIPDRTQRQWLHELQPLNYEGQNYWLMGDITNRIKQWAHKTRRTA